MWCGALRRLRERKRIKEREKEKKRSGEEVEKVKYTLNSETGNDILDFTLKNEGKVIATDVFCHWALVDTEGKQVATSTNKDSIVGNIGPKAIEHHIVVVDEIPHSCNVAILL